MSLFVALRSSCGYEAVDIDDESDPGMHHTLSYTSSTPVVIFVLPLGYQFLDLLGRYV
jgi:hypothetical protein